MASATVTTIRDARLAAGTRGAIWWNETILQMLHWTWPWNS